jgi:hypothetical protein
MVNGVKLLFGTAERAVWTVGVTALLTGTGILVSIASYRLPPIWAAACVILLVALMLGIMHWALVGQGKKTQNRDD